MIRSQQGHRFIKKVSQGDECMQHELDQQKIIIEKHRLIREAKKQETGDPSGESSLLAEKQSRR